MSLPASEMVCFETWRRIAFVVTAFMISLRFEQRVEEGCVYAGCAQWVGSIACCKGRGRGGGSWGLYNRIEKANVKSPVRGAYVKSVGVVAPLQSKPRLPQHDP